ncbi:MAG: glycosyltransferase family 4 protein [Nanoarchaeota archaeon]|nr:glycosyltransferase family 4 protein [Nanoarchaeota archaeon]
MRICFISNFYPPTGTSGADRYLWDVSHKFAEKGIKVEVVTTAPKEIKVKKIERKKNLTIHRLSFMNSLDEKDQRTKGLKLYNYLKKINRTKKIDLISSQALHLWSHLSPSFCSVVTNMFAIEYNIPNILTIHAPFINEEDKIAPKTLFWDKIICVSNAVSEEVHSLNIDVERISTCYPGVDIEKFRPNLGRKWLRTRIGVKEKDKIILFAGRLTEAKGLPVMLKAFATIAQGKKDIKLLLAAGTPVTEEKIKETYEKAELLGIKDQLFIEPFPLEDMPHVYNGCDIFVLPSQYEGFGLVFTEAMACGIPVIGTSVGGVPEVISNGEEGYLVPPNEPTELSKRIDWLLKSKIKRNNLGNKGVEKSQRKFALNKTVEKLMGIHKSAISHNLSEK